MQFVFEDATVGWFFLVYRFIELPILFENV